MFCSFCETFNYGSLYLVDVVGFLFNIDVCILIRQLVMNCEFNLFGLATDLLF